ncbi:DUF3168 domain-containing protein [Pararhodobacter marinus]|uniref:DUF3168 domain-containing protein n=1 Tax=Pararhodobacter marinus TaxID=2184063 RepID=A0A2U2C536_9RHOB|nr:DUF3168 domain-containing protein [Pararhodobacter marinus]PWE27000.1 DUF3168 domain-containing protein [Pararhodobacter marinus]
MTDGPALALQAAVIAALRADSGVAALVGARVYDEPPQDVAFPYIRYGTDNLAPLRLSGECVDEDVAFSVEVHSRPVAGRVEVKRIAHAVRAALDDQGLILPGFRLDWLHYTTQAISRASDGASYIATIAFEAALSAA